MSQQVTKEKYSIETLRERNVSYDHQHWLTQKDVDMANNYVELIERTRSEITPQIGDRLVYVTEHGDYYGNALIDSRSAKEGYLSVCEQPYVPFVWEEDGNIRLSVSGGAFHSVNPEELKFLKWTEGVFKDWGHCGACANGSVSFLAKVPLWFYAEPNPRYGDFTTETYRKFYLHKREESENGNLYQGFDIAFRDEAEFRQFLKDYEGTVFKGNWDNQIVLWCFRREYVFLPSAEWEKIKTGQYALKLKYLHPQNKLRDKQQRTVELEERLRQTMERKIDDKKRRFGFYIERMKGLSPLAKLNQGFAYVSTENGKVVKTIADTANGETLNVYVTDGVIKARVEDTHKEEHCGSRK